MRIAAFGDVHGNLVALEAVLADMAGQRLDAMVCMGDLAFRGPRPAECVARVRGLGIPCVHGNTDLCLLSGLDDDRARAIPAACRAPAASLPWMRWHVERLPADDLAYLAGLPFAQRLEVDGQRLLFVHATPQDCTSSIEPSHPADAVEARVRDIAADWLVMGHIHRAFAFRHGRLQLVNTGAVGFSLDGDPRAAYAVLDPGRGCIALRRVAYDVERALADARDAGFCFPADEYERALRTGFWDAVPWERRQWSVG